MIQITVNGENQTVRAGLNLQELIDHLGLAGGPVAIERNREVVPRREHASTLLADGDVLEIVHFVGGG